MRSKIVNLTVKGREIKKVALACYQPDPNDPKRAEILPGPSKSVLDACKESLVRPGANGPPTPTSKRKPGGTPNPKIGQEGQGHLDCERERERKRGARATVPPRAFPAPLAKPPPAPVFKFT